MNNIHYKSNNVHTFSYSACLARVQLFQAGPLLCNTDIFVITFSHEQSNANMEVNYCYRKYFSTLLQFKGTQFYGTAKAQCHTHS